MNEIARQMIEEMEREEAQRKAANPEPVLKDWGFQKELDLLVKSDFAEVHQDFTNIWKAQAWDEGKPMYHACYRWTPSGRIACFRNQHSTPMAWAQEMHNGSGRHCVVCGRDCFRKKVWAQDGSMRVICMSCGYQGHGLQDLARNAQERQEAIEIERHLDAMGKGKLNPAQQEG